MTTVTSSDEQARAADLAYMKRRATGLLILAATVYLLVRLGVGEEGWAGYVVAFTEAAMVGGLADWFAVTALFRHPLGIPIPHTAIIPNRKNQIGAGLGTFVQNNFLNGDVLAERLEGAELSRRLGMWLTNPEHARMIGDQAAAGLRGTMEVLGDEQVQEGLENVVVARVRSVPMAPLLGRALEVAVEGEHHQEVLDSFLRAVSRLITENRDVFFERIRRESPWWVPEPVDERVFLKIETGAQRFIADVTADPDHEIRAHVDARTRDLAHRLQTSSELRERGEELKEELLAHPAVREWMATMWGGIKDELLAAADDPSSNLRRKLEDGLVATGHRILEDPELAAKVDAWLVSVARYLADQSRNEIAELISTTVARWDAGETSKRIELQVGRDLQFIRINGTIVGGLAGLAIHTVTQFLA